MIQTKIFESSLSSGSTSAAAMNPASSSPTFNQIQISNTTGLSLNDRFTAMSTTAKKDSGAGNNAANQISSSVLKRARSRSVSRERNVLMESLAPVNPFMKYANQRLVEHLQRKHTMQAALKLKRVRPCNKTNTLRSLHLLLSSPEN